MRRFLAVSLILVTLTLALTMMFSPGAAQASSAAPNPLLAGPSPTPTLPAGKLPPSGILLPRTGGDQPDTSTPLLVGAGVVLVVAGLVIRRRQRTVA